MSDGPSSDFVASNQGSIILLAAETEAARDWVHEHLPWNTLTLAGRYAIELRFAGPIIEGIMADGLTIA